VWVHGASVGELIAAVPLIERIRERGLPLLVTSGTVTSAGIARQRLPPEVIHQFIPLDVPGYVTRFLDHWRSSLALFIESDLWPNLIMASWQRGIPLILINGRLSERSYKRWRLMPGLIGALLQSFDLCLVRSRDDARRYGDLGASHVTIVGNLKLDVPPLLSTTTSATSSRPRSQGAGSGRRLDHPGEGDDRGSSAARTFAAVDADRAPPSRRGGRSQQSSPVLGSRPRYARPVCCRTPRQISVCDTVGELGVIYRLTDRVHGRVVGCARRAEINQGRWLAPLFCIGLSSQARRDLCGARRCTRRRSSAMPIALRQAGTWLTDGEHVDALPPPGKRPSRLWARSSARSRRSTLIFCNRASNTMREPRFWRQPGAPARLLAPLGAIYGAITGARMARTGARAGVPVICVGNLTVGGAGKTPTAIAIAKLLIAQGAKPFFLSRGYGGTLAGPVRVGPPHRAADVGDEPLLLAAIAPTIVARDRVRGAAAAVAAGAGVIIMDDGFQNPSLAKDFSLVVLDGEYGTGNGMIFPAGPLRAPLNTQLEHTSALLVLGDEQASASRVIANAHVRGLPVQRACWCRSGRSGRPCGPQGARLRGSREKFFATLTAAGIATPVTRSFADHHAFTPGDAAELLQRAERGGLTLLTTEKDLARMQNDPALVTLARTVTALPVTIVFNDGTLRALVTDAAFAPSRPATSRPSAIAE
jgi:tetraacyldisaccharide 4'-kinase